MIQIKNSGEIISSSEANLKRLRRAFDRNYFIQLDRFLVPELFKKIQLQISRARFYTKIHQGIAQELCMKPNLALKSLHFLINDPMLFYFIHRITGCGAIGNFTGRVYQMNPSPDHFDRWHSDMSQHRMIGMSINLTPEIYEGGGLQLRKRNSRQILNEVHNVGFGDAIIFRLSNALEHRVARVKGKVPKIAFAGWFRSQPNYWATFKDLLKRLSMRDEPDPRQSPGGSRGDRTGMTEFQ